MIVFFISLFLVISFIISSLLSLIILKVLAKVLDSSISRFLLFDFAKITKDVDVFMLSNEGKALILNTSRINPKGSRTTQGATGIKLNEGYKCIAGIIGVTKDYNFKITTQKNKIKEYMLDDIVNQDNTRRLFDYLYGRNGNMGNFVYNTRPTNDLITDFEIL